MYLIQASKFDLLYLNIHFIYIYVLHVFFVLLLNVNLKQFSSSVNPQKRQFYLFYFANKFFQI